ncbi:DUF1990 family protein [Arthrobacter sp.]|uniref:DUF1990 family protein n=1 Tax=Arthrobacter sp. TaxID=1667 RepID=UPI00339A48AE
MQAKDLSGAALTYDGEGLTRVRSAPPGYRTTNVRTAVGVGEDAFRRLAEGLMGWELHRLAGLRVDAAAPAAAEGVDVVPGFGVGPLRLSAPCRVVWTERSPTRTGFGYGTLPGHPESGEEGFVALLEANGLVVLDLFAFSRHSNWFYRAGGPVAEAAQRLVTRRYVAAAKALAGGLAG